MNWASKTEIGGRCSRWKGLHKEASRGKREEGYSKGSGLKRLRSGHAGDYAYQLSEWAVAFEAFRRKHGCGSSCGRKITLGLG